ncbi:hypothetical protein DV735_g1010, partial [Chaetothyriales sp. CBS 134920]
MGPLKWFLYVYLLGGITFLPLVIVCLLVYLHLTSPPVPPTAPTAAEIEQEDDDDPAGLVREKDDKDVFKSGTDDLAEKFHRRHDGDVAAGYFAVSRQFGPGGIVRARPPPDKAAPVAGEAMASETSPSVYQAMYRTIFDRPQKPTIEPQKEGATARNAKKQANNVFYLVLRHGHLMLYDDIQQLEVRYVISLDHHDVDIYSQSDELIPEGELWSKRHAIRLKRKHTLADTRSSQPFFLFTEYTSDKEDFYFALLKNQRRTSDDAPEAQTFDVKHIVSLVQKLHSSEEQLATRWLNALIGRIFLALYRTRELEDFVREKVMKKLSKVKKPNFITRLALRKVDLGTGAPFITNPRLKDLTVNGDCTVEADIDYAGNFKIELGATARIDLGTRFKPRDVDLVLSVTLKRLRGHGLLRVKPPPSNRVWIAFEKMPYLELAVEPIVSSRQITLTLVLRAIESRLREVFAESLVLPFWDDIPFYLTLDQKYRGGIWKHEGHAPASVEVKPELDDDAVPIHLNSQDRNLSEPVLSDVKRFRKSPSTLSDPLPSPPRLMRSSSIATAAGPKITIGHVDGDSTRPEEQDVRKRDSATVVLKDLTTRQAGPTAGSGSGSVAGSVSGSASGSVPGSVSGSASGLTVGWGVLARKQQGKKDVPASPMGRGQPLPPPGQPLPPPQRPMSIAGMANSMLARRRPVYRVLVVAAPIESQPPSPAPSPERDAYFDEAVTPEEGTSEGTPEATSDMPTPTEKESEDGLPQHDHRHQAVEASNRERSLSYLEAASGGGGYNE